MKNRNRTALGLKVDEFISAFGPEHPEIAMLLLEVLEDERAAVKFGLVEKLRRGAPTGRNNRRRIEIARAYLIERHKLGNRRGSAKQATEKICAKYGIDERQLRDYCKTHRVEAYVYYRLAVLEGAFGLTGKPKIPAAVEAEIKRLVKAWRAEFSQVTATLRNTGR